MGIDLYTNNRHWSLKPISLILAVRWPRNQVKVITSLFYVIFFSFLNVIRQNKWHFWTLIQNWTKQICFIRKFWVLEFDVFLPELHLTMGQRWKWVSLLYPSSKYPVKHVSHDTLAIFSHCDLIWPDIDLGLYLGLAFYLHRILVIPSVAIWQS